MKQDDITILKREVETLRAEIVDLRHALFAETDNNTHHFRMVYRYIADIHDYLMPVVHKVFPGYAAAKKQIDTFMESYGTPIDPKKSR